MGLKIFPFSAALRPYGSRWTDSEAFCIENLPSASAESCKQAVIYGILAGSFQGQVLSSPEPIVGALIGRPLQLCLSLCNFPEGLRPSFFLILYYHISRAVCAAACSSNCISRFTLLSRPVCGRPMTAPTGFGRRAAKFYLLLSCNGKSPALFDV